MTLTNTALLLIDIQKGFDGNDFYGANRNNPNAETNASLLLGAFRKNQLPIIHVKHSSLNPESPLHTSKPGHAIKDEVFPIAGETILTKTVNSAFIGTDLDTLLKNNGIKKLVVAGLTSQHCVSTSVRMAANLGFDVLLVEDACAAFDTLGIDGEHLDAKLVHQVSMANLKDEFAQIIKTDAVLQEF